LKPKSDEEKTLNKFGSKIKDTETEVFDSKYISIYNELISKYKISQAMKAGSLGKGTKIKLYGDLDITFTIDNPEIKDGTKLREDIVKKMKDSFPNDDVELLKVSVLIKFKCGIDIDVVYLTVSEYNLYKKQIKHIKSVDDYIKNIIRLVKYWNYKCNNKAFKSFKIEWNAIYSTAGTYKKRVRDTINRSGGYGKVDEIYQTLLKDARLTQ